MTRSGGSPAAGLPATDGGTSSVYVYAVVRAPFDGVSGDGVGARPGPVRKIEASGFVAVVSDVPESWRAAGRADVEAHDRVLAGLLERWTVVPMRFGIVMATDDEVRERLLERHAEDLEALFERLDGRQQMTVKAYYVNEGLLREVLRRNPELKRRSDALEREPPAASHQQRIDLGREVAAAVEEQRALDERVLVEPLGEAAEAIRVEPPVSEKQAVTVQLLVDAQRRSRLDAAVQRLSAEHADRLAFRYVGPLPPYSFCDLILDEER
ncbi:GvpL/GvpF family gas vesicle protein [Candidatus Solirubrobacter pratensis]|uniref:GvpL/GvpF family gas vesicle protein n=1 Tax=Candidatus Solirubrobacter pratensis TaxID=1298857 RepID=UPI00040010B5|nr:GvpL/GvpF family gas vesicle protein [Candidatus Solirubrobacter pratensis]